MRPNSGLSPRNSLEVHRLLFPILPQPDESTCGPTALHAVYQYFDDELPLQQVIDEVETVNSGGTLGVLLGLHSLKRGYQATLYTCNLHVFDPTWFNPDAGPLIDCLQAQMKVKDDPKLQTASQAYIEFIQLGGQLRMEDISVELIRQYLSRGIPILSGLSMTWLYRDQRESVVTGKDDDIGGEPVGHFAVLCGLDSATENVLIADPYEANPHSDGHHYEISLERVLCAILLGIVTYDANLLVIEPRDGFPSVSAPLR
ncbi:MAG: hypothetical protein O3B13_01855 [Planctomycetota bacterium]|nr:hypothetical protein [Planctomycetota bacterium]MDA1161824.1 hypothetical protein [Planctomycetota bacterium]